MDALADACNAGNTTRALEIVDIEGAIKAALAKLESTSHTAISSAGTIASGYLADAGIEFSWESVNADALAWVRSHGAEQVTSITEETRNAIRSIIERVFAEGRNPDWAARNVRDVVGLSERQASAVANRRANLEAAGASQADIEHDSAKYSRDLLKQRGEMIGRTEIMTASNKGQRMVWEGAADKGLLGDNAEREWIVTDDESTCDDCAEMDGETAAIGEPYSNGDDGPPDHPLCRCCEGITFNSR